MAISRALSAQLISSIGSRPAIFFKCATFARSRSFSYRSAFPASATTVLGGAVERRSGLILGCSSSLVSRLQVALIEIAPPDHDLVGVADFIERRDLTTGKLLAIQTSQYLQLELRTVRAALGAQTVDAVQAVVAHPRAKLLLGNRPPPSQELRAAFASQEALDHFQLDLRFVLLHVTP